MGVPTKRKYWRCINCRRRCDCRHFCKRLRRSKFQWRWGKGTKKQGKRKYRLRVLYARKGNKLVPTKRKYWRCTNCRRRRNRRSKFQWRWGKGTEKQGKKK